MSTCTPTARKEAVEKETAARDAAIDEAKSELTADSKGDQEVLRAIPRCRGAGWHLKPEL